MRLLTKSRMWLQESRKCRRDKQALIIREAG